MISCKKNTRLKLRYDSLFTYLYNTWNTSMDEIDSTLYISGSLFDLALATRIYATSKSILSRKFYHQLYRRKTTRVFRAVRQRGIISCRRTHFTRRASIFSNSSALIRFHARVTLLSTYSDNSPLLFNWL